MTDNNQHVNEQDEWRVGEFWSSASPGKKVLMLSRADQIGSDSGHKDFIRWVVGSHAALAHPIGQQACKGDISQSAPSSAPAADRAQSGKAAAANAGGLPLRQCRLRGLNRWHDEEPGGGFDQLDPEVWETRTLYTAPIDRAPATSAGGQGSAVEVKPGEACPCKQSRDWCINNDCPELPLPCRTVAVGAGVQWVDVDDRLPENSSDVIVLYWPYGNHENEQVAGSAHHVEGTFYDEDGNDMHPPSHWMPFNRPAAKGTDGQGGAV